MRSLLLPLFLAAPLAAQQPAAHAHDADPDHMQQGGTLPAGWAGRTDRGQPLSGARFAAMGTGFHVTTGPAVILYRAADRANGEFHTLATFTQMKAPMHPEAYGLFVGGRALDGEGQQYLYFLVRGNGQFLIKKREGANVTTVVDWTANPAVVAADSAGKAANKLEILSKGGQLTFSVNGTQVHQMAMPTADATGIVGLRVNHNLDVHVEGFALHQIGGGAGH